MKDNQTKYPQLRFKGFTDSWEERKLGEVSKYSNGGSYENDVVENGTYELITLKSVNMSGKLVSSGKFINRETKTLEKDTLVMILSEQAPGLLGMTAKIPENNRYVLNQRVAEIKPNTNIDSYFLSMSINRSQAYFSKRGAGTKVQNISKPNVENFEFYCPSEREQQKIGSFFKHLDDTIALHQRKLAMLKELKQSYLQKLFPQNGSKFPQLRFAGFADAWEQRKLGEVGKTQSGIGFPDAEQGGTEGVPFYKVSDMNKPGNEHEMVNANNYVNYEQLSRKKWKIIETVPAVIFAKVGAAIMLNRKRLVTSPFLIDNNTMAYVFDGYWNIDFGKTLFETINLPRYAQVGALPSYNGSDIESIEVTLPNKGEQVKLGAFFKSLDDTITLHQRKLEKLQELKKGYLQKMFC